MRTTGITQAQYPHGNAVPITLVLGHRRRQLMLHIHEALEGRKPCPREGNTGRCTQRDISLYGCHHTKLNDCSSIEFARNTQTISTPVFTSSLRWAASSPIKQDEFTDPFLRLISSCPPDRSLAAAKESLVTQVYERIGDVWAEREKSWSVDPPLPREAVRNYYPFLPFAKTQSKPPPCRWGQMPAP